MEIRQGVSKADFKSYDTERIRKEFLIDKLFRPDEAVLVYSHIDRIIAGSIVPVEKTLPLSCGDELRCAYFLERREIGIINIGGEGEVRADGKTYTLNRLDCLYLGRGVKNVEFSSCDKKNPALFYLCSTPAHKEYPSCLVSLKDAVKAEMGSKSECNERTIYKYILPQNVKSCQLVMGVTILKDGSVWNTMPTHTHERRMEVYLYFDVSPGNTVFHFMGDPSETRHLTVGDKQAVISPSFSIHSGCGTKNYSFIWGMCGENQDFDDMDFFKTEDLK